MNTSDLLQWLGETLESPGAPAHALIARLRELQRSHAEAVSQRDTFHKERDQARVSARQHRVLLVNAEEEVAALRAARPEAARVEQTAPLGCMTAAAAQACPRHEITPEVTALRALDNELGLDADTTLWDAVQQALIEIKTLRAEYNSVQQGNTNAPIMAIRDVLETRSGASIIGRAAQVMSERSKALEALRIARVGRDDLAAFNPATRQRLSDAISDDVWQEHGLPSRETARFEDMALTAADRLVTVEAALRAIRTTLETPQEVVLTVHRAQDVMADLQRANAAHKVLSDALQMPPDRWRIDEAVHAACGDLQAHREFLKVPPGPGQIFMAVKKLARDLKEAQAESDAAHAILSAVCGAVQPRQDETILVAHARRAVELIHEDAELGDVLEWNSKSGRTLLKHAKDLFVSRSHLLVELGRIRAALSSVVGIANAATLDAPLGPL